MLSRSRCLTRTFGRSISSLRQVRVLSFSGPGVIERALRVGLLAAAAGRAVLAGYSSARPCPLDQGQHVTAAIPTSTSLPS